MPLAPAVLPRVCVPTIDKLPGTAAEDDTESDHDDDHVRAFQDAHTLAAAAAWAKTGLPLLAPWPQGALVHGPSLNMSTHFSGIGTPELAARFINSALRAAGGRESDMFVSRSCLEAPVLRFPDCPIWRCQVCKGIYKYSFPVVVYCSYHFTLAL